MIHLTGEGFVGAGHVLDRIRPCGSWFAFVNGIAVLLATYLIPGLQVNNAASGLIAGIVLGIVNAIIRPLLILSSLHKAGSKTAAERIAAADLDRPLRLTGQMMFDGSHTPCGNGTGSQKRVSVWEIHPVYAIDVCKKKAVSACRIGVADDWKPLTASSQ